MTNRRIRGLVLSCLGVLTFSVTFPATAEALNGFSAYTIGIGRAVAAGGLAACWLAIRHVPVPQRRDLLPLAVVAAGVVVGFPLLTALALRNVTSSHAAVVTGLLPVATAAFGELRGGERPGLLFWAAAAVGAVIVIGYIVGGGAASGAGRFSVSDLLLLGSLAAGGAAYAEGGALARRMPGWQVISWALVLALPVTVPVTVAATVAAPPHPGLRAVAGFGYVSLFSMFLGFFAWYRGLADAGVARASQVQLAQPLLTVLWSAVLLGERLSGWLVLTAAGVLVSVAAAQHSRPARGAPGAAAPANRSPAGPAPDPGDPGTAGSPPR